MKHTIKHFTIIFSFIITALPSVGQNITFRSLTPENGLSQISVNDLYQDERGFIWIGTREGINCYNGNGIQIYKSEKNNPNSLFSNHVLKLAGNRNGKVYLLCVDGVAEWDMKKEIFSTKVKASNITAIHYNEALFVGRNHEVLILHDNGDLEPYYQLPHGDEQITAIFIDEKGILWVGTANRGLYRVDKSGGQHTQTIEKGNITRIYADNDGDIWAGSWEHGLYRITGNDIIRYLHNPQKNSISSDFVRTCIQDNQGNIWIGTFSGLDKLDKKTGEFSHYSTSVNSRGMTHNSIWAMIKDHQGTIWFGTYFGGVNYFNPDYEIYTHYTVSAEESKGLSSPVVGNMIEDDNHNLWICTEGGGVNVYNRRTKTFKWYQHDAHRNSISHNNVKSIYYDSDHDIMWIGTHLGGLNKLDLKTDVFTHYRSVENDSTSLPSDIIRDILPYNDDLIVATQNGVCLFSPRTGKCRQMFKDTEEGRLIKMVADLFIDYYGTLWIAATGEGMFSYDFEKDLLTHYKHDPADSGSISNNNITNIHQDHYYNLWLSTSGSGLDLFDYQTGKFSNFDSKNNGLVSDCIYMVCKSRHGQLLLITNQGFSQFDPSDNTFYNYSNENGFPLSAVNENALYLTYDGEIFLGGVQGMVSFYERDIRFTKKGYEIVPYRLTVNNMPVTVGDETDILHASLYANPEITLESKYSVFSIEYATTNYIPANKDRMMYRLEGFSSDWINANDQNTITYTNLNPGNYTLVVRADSDKPDHVPETRLAITVLPPFYKTTYAYLFYFIIAATILYFTIKSYKGRIKLQESLKYEQKHIQDIEELNQSKLRFFTNVSHEFRTPLTLIIGQIEMLMQLEPFTPKVYNKLLSVYKSSLQMRGLITELLDFRKQEQGYMTIKVSEINIVDFLKENYLLFQEYANIRDIRFTFHKEADILNVWFDSKQIQKVLNNLVSNALKHTEAGGEISISIKQDNGFALLEVSDTGAGIEAADLGRIFNRFYQTDDTSSGTGIGLALTKGIVEAHHGRISVESEKGKGTTFKVYLKLGKEHFDREQIVESEPSVVKEKIIPDAIDAQFTGNFPDESISVKRAEGVKMLIVEDNQALREMLVRIFEPFYEIVSAVDGEEGLKTVKREMPSLILSDVLMPKMSGVELCREVKTDLETSHIPVVLLTARTAIEHTLEGLQNGADDYITKPFHIDVLISRCNNLVNSRMVLQEKFSRQPQMTPLMLATNRLDKEMIDKVMNVVNENITNPEFNIDQLADELHMARTNLYAKIKAITGQTPNKFILTVRLKKAAYLLRNNPELNISEIADMTGFTSSTYFGKCFKSVFHTTPLGYRTGDNTEEDI